MYYICGIYKISTFLYVLFIYIYIYTILSHSRAIWNKLGKIMILKCLKAGKLYIH